MAEIEYSQLPEKFRGVDPEPDVMKNVSWGDSWTASWTTESSDEALLNIFADKMPETTPAELDLYNSGQFNSYQELEKKYPELAHESLFEYFDDLQSVRALDYMAKRIGRQVSARRTQQNAPGFQQFVTDAGAGTIGSASLWGEAALLAVPFSKPARVAWQGARTGTRVVMGGVLAGSGSAIDEFILYQDQELRTKTEFAFGVGAGVLLGGALGGLSGVLRPSTVSINPDMSATAPTSGGAIGAHGEAGGAAARLQDITQTDLDAIMGDPSLTDRQKFLKVSEKQAEQYQIEPGFASIGRGAAKLGAFTRLNPETTLSVSESPIMVRFNAFMTNSALLKKGEKEGEGFVNIDAIGRRGDTNIEEGVNKIYVSNYRNYKKAEKGSPDVMSQLDFDNQVRVAATRGDEHINPHVQKAAQDLRREFTGPMGIRGVRHKQLLGDESGNPVAPLGDKSWFFRSYSRNFAGRVTPEQYADGLVPGYMKRLGKQAADEKVELELKVSKLREELKAKGEKIDSKQLTKIRSKNPYGRELKRLNKNDTVLRNRLSEMRNEMMNGSDRVDGHEFSGLGLRTNPDGSLKMSESRTLDIATEDIPLEYFDPDPKMSIINALKRMNRMLLIEEDDRFLPSVDGAPAGSFKHWIDARNFEHDARLEAAGSDLKKTEKLRKQREVDINYINKLAQQYYGIRPDNPSAYARTTLANLKAFTALTGLGSVLFSTVAELGAGLAFYGVQGYIRHVSSAVLDPRVMAKLTKTDMATMDIGIQGSIGMRIMEVGEYAGDMGKYSRMLHKAADRAVDKVYMLGTWTRTMATQFAIMAQSEMARKIMKPNMSKRDLSDLGRFGLNKEQIVAVRKELSIHGKKRPGGAWDANIDSWGSESLKKHVGNALNQEVDNIIIRPGIGSTPLIGKTLVGSALLQFKQFLLAATSKYGIADIQRLSMGDLRGVERQMALAALGYMSIGLKNNYLYGPDAKKRWDGMSEKERIIEGVIQGGGGGLAYDMLNLARESTYPGSSSRYYGQRSLTSMALGPNFGKVEDVYNLFGMLGAATSKDQDFNKAQLKSVMRNIPGLSFWAVRMGWPTMKDDIYETIK